MKEARKRKLLGKQYDSFARNRLKRPPAEEKAPVAGSMGPASTTTADTRAREHTTDIYSSSESSHDSAESMNDLELPSQKPAKSATTAESPPTVNQPQPSITRRKYGTGKKMDGIFAYTVDDAFTVVTSDTLLP